MNRPRIENPEDILRIGIETLDTLLANNQLALCYLWANACNISEAHLSEIGTSYSEIGELIKKYKDTQESQLATNGLTGKYNSIMSIFLLKAKHGYMETDKRILTGSKDEPITINIIQDTTLKDIDS